MADSMTEVLRREMKCEGLLECFHDLTALDREIFQRLNERQGPLTVDEIAEGVDRERSTAHRGIQRLLEAGFIRKEQVNYEHGGYYHVYHPRDADEVTREMQRARNDWYAKMGQLIGEFEDRYGEGYRPATPAEG